MEGERLLEEMIDQGKHFLQDLLHSVPPIPRGYDRVTQMCDFVGWQWHPFLE